MQVEHHEDRSHRDGLIAALRSADAAGVARVRFWTDVTDLTTTGKFELQHRITIRHADGREYGCAIRPDARNEIAAAASAAFLEAALYGETPRDVIAHVMREVAGQWSADL